MFVQKKRAGINYDKVDTIIGQGTEFKGSIRAKGTLRIEGRLEGDVSCDGDIIVSETACVEANIRARHVTAAGEIKGDLDLAGRLEISPTGKVCGTIRVANLVINEGGLFLGNSIMCAEGETAKRVEEELA
ncbi:MAG: bactofilin family protein [bacterium]|jgi:cytoskeletal protein CcmA (bactofilin family)